MKRLLQNRYSVFALILLGVLAVCWFVVSSWHHNSTAPVSEVEDEDMEWMQQAKWEVDWYKFFPEGAWERSSRGKIWKDDYIFLFDGYKERDNRIELNCCTVLLRPGACEIDDERLVQEAIILQGTGTAILEFDRPVCLFTLGSAKFVRGRFIGEVTIQKNMQKSGLGDGWKIIARDVFFNNDLIQADFSARANIKQPHNDKEPIFIKKNFIYNIRTKNLTFTEHYTTNHDY